MAELVALPTGGTAGKTLTVATAADAFLGSLGNPNTVRNYGIGIGKSVERLGEAKPLASVTDEEIGEALELLWGSAAVNTWNARRASVGSWLAWCRERGYDAPIVPAWTKRLAVPDSETPARSRMEIDRLIARREVGLREKTLYRMLYETAGRAEEILGVNVEDLDFVGRRCRVKAKGARAKTRRRGQAREDVVLETVYWDAGSRACSRAAPGARCSSPTAAPGRARCSPRAMSVPTLGLLACRTVRPARCWTLTPHSAGLAQGGTCTRCGIRPSPTWVRVVRAC